MGREVRRVPKDWQHPRGEDGRHNPLYDDDYETAAANWKKGFAAWEARDKSALTEILGYKFDSEFDYEWWEYSSPPDPEYHRPKWREEDRTHFQMYETTSEGTPISPVMESPEALARWLADNRASAFAGDCATYEQWLRVCKGGYAPSAIVENGVLKSGVAG